MVEGVATSGVGVIVADAGFAASVAGAVALGGGVTAAGEAAIAKLLPTKHKVVEKSSAR